MSERTDDELVEIVTSQRSNYQPEASLAAEEELKKRELYDDDLDGKIKKIHMNGNPGDETIIIPQNRSSAKLVYQLLSTLYGLALALILVAINKLSWIGLPVWIMLIATFICVFIAGKLVYYLIHLPKIKITSVSRYDNGQINVNLLFGYSHGTLLPVSLSVSDKTEATLKLPHNVLKRRLNKGLNKRKHINNLTRMVRRLMSSEPFHNRFSNYMQQYSLVIESDGAVYELSYYELSYSDNALR